MRKKDADREDLEELLRSVALKISNGNGASAKQKAPASAAEAGPDPRSRSLVRRYENAVRRRPAAAANWFRLGKLLLDLGEYRRAEAMLRRAVQRGPRFANYRFYLGEALAGGGKLAEAAGHFRFLANADPGLADPMPVADECDCRQNAVPGARPGLPRRRGGGAET